MKKVFFSSGAGGGGARSKQGAAASSSSSSSSSASIIARPTSFATSPLDEPTTLHWSFHVPPSAPAAPPASSLSAIPPIVRASPANPIAERALNMTSASIKLLRPQAAFVLPLPVVVGPPAYDVVDVKGKGRGMVANRTIKEGETIFYDRPLLIFDPVRGPTHRMRSISNSEFAYAVAHLLPQQQRIFYALANVYAGTDKALGIVETTAATVVTLPGDNITYSAIFPLFAMLNHSCDPNVGLDFEVGTGSLRVYAIREIEKGSEMETTYIITAQKRRERRSQLMHQYRFECQCAWCSLSDEESAVKDEEREKMAEAFLKFLG